MQIGNTPLEKILIAVLVFVFVIVVSNVFALLLRKFLSKRVSKHNAKIASLILQYAFVGVAIYFGMYRALGLDLSGFAASLGVITIAMAFSSQQLVQNFIAGIILTLQKTIEIGDWVDIGPGTGMARVKDISLMRITVRDVNGKIQTLANSIVLTSRIINFTESGFIEVSQQISVPYNSDLKRLKDVILETLRKNNRILPNVSQEEKKEVKELFKLQKIRDLFAHKFDVSLFQPYIYIVAVDYPKIVFDIRFWVRATDKRDEIISEFLETLTERLKKEKIDLN